MKNILKWAGIALSALCLVGLGALLAGGGDSPHEQAALADNSTVDATAVEDESTPQPTPETTPTPAPTDCDALGINPQDLKEGPCESDGTKVLVVNKGTALKLKEVTVKLLSIGHTSTIPRPYDSPLVGSYVVARVAVTNRLNSPVDIDASSMFALWLDNKGFSPDFDAMNESGDDGLIYETIQPDETATGIVAFRVKPSRAKGLAENGNLEVKQFSDVDSLNEAPSKRVGVIRTYN